MAMSESRRRKLEMLTRSIARGDVPAAQRVLGDDETAGPRPPTLARRSVEPVALDVACPGRCLAWEGLPPGEFWQVRHDWAGFAPGEASVVTDGLAVLRGARQRFDELKASAELCRIADGGPEDLLFMDLETCGFAGTPIFLVGMMYFEDDRLIIEQCFARDYAEEGAILSAYADRHGRGGMLVTFNGKSYDMPRLVERGAFHGVELDQDARGHLDLLHEARRFYKGRLPNCKLQTLEKHLAGRHRTGDIPGSAIPEAYHRFVDTGDARQVADILHHNVLDLVTMLQVLCSLLTSTSAEP